MRYGAGSFVAMWMVGGCVITVVQDKGVGPSGETGDTELPTTETDEPIPTATTGDTGDTGVEDADDDLDGFPASVDCNDNDELIHPDAEEACDGVDNNCDALIDDAFAATIGTTNYASVDDALADAVDGSRVDVCPGDHAVTGRSWTSGELRLRGIAGRDLTTLHEAADGLLFSVGEDSILGLRGFTLQGSSTSADRVLVVEDNGTLELTECAVRDNAAGAIELVNTSAAVVVITDCTLSGHGVPADPLLGVPASPAEGGAIKAVGLFDLTLTDSVIEQNAAIDGGGIFAKTFFGFGTLTLDGSTLNANVAEDEGGGLYVASGEVTGSNGAALSTNEAALGGGVVLLKSTLTGVLVSQNAAVLGGGVATIYDSLFAPAPLDDALTGVIVDSNTADLGAGIAVGDDVDLDGTSAVTLNVATTDGGGVYVPVDDLTVTSAGADFGAASTLDDNAPNDVSANSMPYDYDGAATFTCVGDSGC